MKFAVRPVVLALVASGATLMAAPLPAIADADAHAGVVDARPRDAAVHAVDGEVRTVAQVGGAVVLGGSFTKVGPVTRGAVGVVDTVAKTFQAGFPDVVGAATAVVSDGLGGWYLGGTFSSVGGVARTNLAQVDAAGAVTAFNPAPNAPVTALRTASNGDLVVGGSFTSIAGQPGAGLAVLDGAGAPRWAGTVTGGAVRALATSADGATIYLGGDFAQIGGVQRRRLGAVDAASGALNTTFVPGVVNLPVNDMVVRSGSVLLTGEFTKVNGVTRNRLAQVNGTTGALDALSVSINNTVRDIEYDAGADVAYLAGSFGTVGGATRNRLAAVNLVTGAPTSLALSGISGDLAAAALDGAGSVFVGGSMQITPEKDNPAVLAKVSIATNVVSSLVPYAETPRSLARPPVTGASGALALVRSGTSLLVAGDFSDYGLVSRSGLAAYTLATGALRSDFDPAPDGQVNIAKAAADGAAVFVGGEFETIDGAPHSHLAKLDIATGHAVDGFTTTASSYVKDLAVRTDGSTLYVGGNFDVFNAVPTSKLVAVDASTGATVADFAMPLSEPTNETSEGGLRAMALSPDQSRLMVVGNFRTVAGVERPLIAQIDVAAHPAAVTTWQTDVYDQPCARSGQVGWMRDVDISPDSQTAYVVSAGHFYYPACDSVNAFPMAPGASVKPAWTKKVGDTLEAVAAGPDALYISGHFRYMETETHTQNRFQIAALDPQTGEALNWVPDAGGFRGVLTLELEPAGLFSGSDGDAYGGVNHGRNAFWPTPSPGIEVRKTPSRPWVLAPSGPVAHQIRVHNTFGDRAVTLTSLTDERLGSLSGSGTCTLPQTVPAGGTYTCSTAAETVSGPAATAIASTVTAVADAAGAAVSDTDRSTVQIIATAPVFRVRAVVGPGQIAFPGQTVRFSVTMMNLDLERSATLTTLTSPTFGDVSAECGLPRVLSPNQLHYCHVDRFVTGSVGSKPSFTFTGAASYNTGPLTSASSQTVTVNPPVGGTKVLAVVANPAVLPASDKQVEDRVEDSFAITYADDDTVTAADVSADYSYVILYPSVVEAKLGARLRDLSRPVMVLHSRMLDEMGMTAVGQNGTELVTTATIVKPMHPLSAARFGATAINTAAIATGYGVPTPAAEVVSQLDPAKPHEFAYHQGAAMSTGAAASCRVFFSAGNTTKFTATAWTLFNRAAAYTSMNCGANMLWTSAGNGQSAYGGADGRSSVEVGLNTPWGLAVDGQDRIYVADAGNNAVRRIDPNGIVTTVAGTGTAGFSGDGGPATAARLSAPVRLAFDPAGNLYIADSANNRIRKVTPGGTISTVAGNGQAGNQGDGGQATAARLRTPYDVAVAADGTMYIADRANHKVRKVTAAGVISTFAGNGSAGYNGDEIAATSARLSSPYSVDVDAGGNVYIADYDNERVRRVDTGGLITTFAGTGVPTADGDGGLAIEAGLHKPQYVQVTPAGEVYISESNSNRVRVVHDETIDTIAGSGQFGYVGDGGFPLFSTWQRPSSTVLDSQGNLWVADRNNRRLRVISAS